ncbi:tryptophan synthase subunit alpha [Brevibacterium sp. CS2]|uniref:tryptophan synthase subunit alpha n=1 Tax=Brevibacterium sp. CS2 TaxID=2575923 RepID=UPI0010C7D90F|nr:tryptophan synthase subunit alpha [Brevibacterium sp. CS2]QCP05859.1 tryptophan synthase subunit alpha [Brevibacterium sp. CS2]
MSTAPVLRACAAENRAAFIGYLPVGYPDVPGSLDAMRALVAGGVDIVEVGMPYSDPGMDGPVIEAAGVTALAGGVRTRDVLTAIEAVREAGAAAVTMTYWNIVERYGVEAFARDLAAAGGSGIVTPDLVPDEAGEWIAASDAHGLDRIFLVAPSSRPERLAYVAGSSRGFVYAASTMGVTGTRAEVGSAAAQLVADTRSAGAEHVCVGLGVSTREQAAEVAAYADGVIVGSALVKALDSGGTAALERQAAEFAAGVRDRG